MTCLCDGKFGQYYANEQHGVGGERGTSVPLQTYSVILLLHVVLADFGREDALQQELVNVLQVLLLLFLSLCPLLPQKRHPDQPKISNITGEK